MNKKAISSLIIAFSTITPYLAYAADDLEGIVDVIGNLLTGYIIPLLFLIATVVFLFGVITYLTAGGDESKASSGKNYIIWSVIAMFAMLSIWGIVWAVSASFSLPGSGIPGSPI